MLLKTFLHSIINVFYKRNACFCLFFFALRREVKYYYIFAIHLKPYKNELLKTSTTTH